MNPLDHPICLVKPLRLTTGSTWVGHIPFAMWLVDLLRPATIVELGSASGESYCAFCQAVRQLELPTRCFSVDTWIGDHQTGFYSQSVYEDLNTHNDTQYKDFSTLLRMRFDEALKQFPDNSIDLLHIDGLHTYEAVKHDFETWQPKLSPSATVLFHDICIRIKDFGVWRFWDEVKSSGPHFEFGHSCGLGVLAAGAMPPQPIRELSGLSGADAEEVRFLFSTLGEPARLSDTSPPEPNLILANTFKAVANWCFSNGRSEEGLRYCERSLDIQPDDEETLVLLLCEHCRTSEFAKARPVCKKLLELTPDDPKRQELWQMLSTIPPTP